MNDPAIYHITHVDNLPRIVADGRLWSDAQRIARGLASTNIGYSHIKERRMKRPVLVAAGGTLGQYAPFNFCPRSVMLYVLSQGHQDYSGGQSPIIHLVSSIQTAVATGRPWFFTDRHADLGYAQQFASLDALEKIDWQVMPLRQWGGNTETKEKRQAEFLLHDWCPWTAITGIAVISDTIAEQVQRVLMGSDHRPQVTVRRDWYY
jgi:hypothetical protein